MLFASVSFLFFFLPNTLLILYLLRTLSSRTKVQNYYLLLASIFFYFWGESWQTWILSLTVLSTYAVTVRMTGVGERQKKSYLAAGIVFNLSLLVGFKYVGFIGNILNTLFRAIQINFRVAELAPHLPLGISFFVFHAISYMVDVYRGQKAETRLSVVSLYFFLFPHQIAGPIVRYHHFAKDVDVRNITSSDFAYGAERFIYGLAKKVLVANPAAKGADGVFAMGLADLSSPLAWIGIICYTIQIYFDFSGYSDMAIGLARMLGFHFHENFNFPYAARSITDFWRRWHISLSTWFRDYVYIPLGGNRVSRSRNYFNLAIVFALCGLWHGASWVFLVWGLWHGLFLIIERMGLEKKMAPHLLLSRIWTLLVVMIGWVFFRSENLAHAFHYIVRLFSFTPVIGDSEFQLHLIGDPVTLSGIFLGLLLASGTVGAAFRKNLSERSELTYYAALLVVFILTLSQVASSTFNPFIYFRF